MRRLSLLVVLGLLACGTRRPPPRATPAVTTVFIQFDQQTITLPNAEQLGGVMGSMLSLADSMGGLQEWKANYAAEMESRLRSALVEARVAIPVLDRGAADLIMKGTVAPLATGMQWQMVDAAGSAVVLAGSERINQNRRGEAAIEAYVDRIVRDLLASNIDDYAGRAKSAPQVAQPKPSGPARVDAPPARTDGSKAFAVVIGVETYREALPPATHAEADARAFAVYAHKTLGVPEAHIKLLTGERAGRADLQSMLEEWLPRNAGPHSTVYVFFSGHGAPDPQTGETYLVPWDAEPRYIKTRGISIRSVYAALNALPAQQAYVFLDACFSGSGQRSVIAQGTRPLVPVQTVTDTGKTIALTASGAQETTGAARDAAHGLFTRYLLAGMGGAADTNGDDDISLGELADYVKTQVAREARLDNREQTPSLMVRDGLVPAQHILINGLWK
jgi:hypothetical protein